MPAGEGARDPFLKGRWRSLSGGAELEGLRGGPRTDPELLQTCPIETRITPRISYLDPRTRTSRACPGLSCDPPTQPPS